MKRFIRKVTSLFENDRFFYPFFLSLVILVAQIPIILRQLHTLEGHYYPYLDAGALADFYYMAAVRTGMGSDWLFRIPFVVSDHQGSLIQILFPLLGKLALVFNTGAAEVLYFGRIAGGLVYGLSVSFLVRLLLPKNKARIAFLLFLFAQPVAVFNINLWVWDSGTWVWNFHEAARRIGMQPPHYTLGRGLAIFSLYFFIKAVNQKDLKKAFISAVFGFFGGLVYPPPAFMILVTAVFSGLFFLARHIREADKILGVFKANLPKVTPFFLGIFLSLVILKLELLKGYPWTRWTEVELGWNEPRRRFEMDYLRSLTPLLVLVPYGIFEILRKKTSGYWNYFIFVWSISAFLLFPFANMLSLGKFRFAEGAQIVAVSVMAVIALSRISKKTETLSKRLSERTIFTATLAFTVLYFILQCAFSEYNFTVRLWPRWTNTYFRSGEMEALKFIDANLGKNTVIVADQLQSNFIPAFSRAKTITGYPDVYKNKYDYQKDKQTIIEIINNRLPFAKTQEFMKSYNAEYIYIEGSTGVVLSEAHFKKVFDNHVIQIYKPLMQ